MLVLFQGIEFLNVALVAQLSTLDDLLRFSQAPVISKTTFDQSLCYFKVAPSFFDSGRRFRDRTFEVRKLNDIVSFEIFFQIKLCSLLRFFGREN